MKAATAAVAVAVLLSALLLPILLGGLASLRHLAALPAAAWVLLLALGGAGVALRALKLVVLTRGACFQLGLGRALTIALGSDFCFLVTPGGLGGLPGTIFLLRRSGVPYPVAAAVIAGDQVLDGAFFACALPIVVLLAWDSGVGRLVRDITPYAALFVALLIGCVAAPRVLWNGVICRGMMPKVPAWLRQFRVPSRSFFAQSLASFRHIAASGRHRLLGAFLLTALQWIARYTMLALIVASLGYDVPLPQLFLLQAAIVHLAQWSGAPGGVGVTELLTTFTLSRWLPVEAASTALLAWRAMTLHVPVIVGALAFAVIMRMKAR